MPVKVRCPGCRKVLTAPDAARGKALKCPECETKVRIPDSAAPAGKGGGKSAGKGGEKNEDDLLAKLDLSKAADTAANLCTKCGAEIPEGASECPQCGVDPNTGELSKAARKRKTLKGADPADFFKNVWSDAWSFTMENLGVVVRTFLYLVMYAGLAAFCAYMVVDVCERTPPKVFWGGIGTLALLVLPGWIWHMTVEAVKVTTFRKSKMSDVKFDTFTSVALGIKTLVWVISHVWLPPALFCLPIAQIHFAMPVPDKAWLAPFTFKVGMKHSGAVIYFWVIWLVMNLLALGILGGLAAAFWFKFSQALDEGDIRKMGNTALYVSLGGVVVVLFLYSFSAVFMARVTGLIGYYFRDTLELATIVQEKTYVKKQVKLDKFGNPIESPVKKIGALVFALFGILLAANVIYYLSTRGEHILLPDSWARALGILKQQK